MKQKLHKILGGLALHLVLSGVVLGCIRVYQQGYNKTHREQLQMASLTVQEQQAELQILGRSCIIPMQLLAEDSLLYYAFYFLSDSIVQSWVYGISEFIEWT